jgi:CelD/BcsL family acetyltransferase involved in cellulose biosynthesis
MRIVQLSPEDPRWTDFISSQRQAFIYHHPLWTEVIKRAYGHRNATLAVETPDARIVGVLPLMRTWGISTGVRFASLPHTPVAGPVTAAPEIAFELIAAAIQLVGSTRGASLQLKTVSALPPALAALQTVGWESTFTLQIPARGEEIRFGNSRHHQRVLWAVRHGERLGCRVVEAQSVAELRQWYQLYLHTMQRKVVPPRPFRFFVAAWDVLRPAGLMRLLLARDGSKELIAGALLFTFGETVFYAFNGRQENRLSLRPNDLLQWRAIHDAQAAGYRFYDFGEVEAHDEGLADFKRKWGARPHQLWRHYYPAQREPEANRLLQSDAVQWIVSATWRSLPVKATGVLGGWIYSYL